MEGLAPQFSEAEPRQRLDILQLNTEDLVRNENQLCRIVLEERWYHITQDNIWEPDAGMQITTTFASFTDSFDPQMRLATQEWLSLFP